MEPDIIQTSNNFSPIIIALIGALGGLVSGVIASLIAPWVQHAIQSRRKAIEYNEKLILDTRQLLDNVQSASEIRSSSLWGFINDSMNDDERSKFFPGAYIAEISNGPSDNLSQDDHRKQGISMMLARLEKEWKLTRKP